MHFFSVVAACLLCSSLAAAGPLPRDRSRKLQFRQAAPFKNTTSTTGAVIEVVPVSLTETSLSTATTSSPSTELSTASAATTLSTSAFANTTLPSAPSTTATGAGDLPTAAGDGPNAAQTAIGTSQTPKQSFSSNLSGAAPSGSIVQGTGSFSRTTVVSANSNTDASAGSEPTTGTQVFPFAESLTTTPSAISTTAEAEFTFSSDPVTPTTLSTRTTNAPVAITVSGEGAAVTVTPSFFSSVTPVPSTTVDEAIIKVATVITAAASSDFPSASASAGVAKNVKLATYFNNLFPTLTADMPCAPNSIACIEGAVATCEDGRYVLKECFTDKFACFALPLKFSEGVSVQCTSVETAEKALGLPNSLSVTIGSVPVVVPTTTAEAVAQSTSVTDPGPTTSAVEAKATVAAVLSSESDDGEEEEGDELTTVLHTTLVSTITIAVSDFAPSTVVAAAEAATVEAAAPMVTTDKSRISVVPVGAAVGGSGNEEEGGKEAVKEGGPVTVTVTRSVTVTEQFTVTRAGVTSTVTAGDRE